MTMGCAGALLLATILSWTPLNLAGADLAPGLDPELPYQAERTHPVTYDVDFSIVITAPYHTQVLKVWLPLPKNDGGQEVTASALTTFPLKVEPSVAEEKVFGNTFAFFEFSKPEGAQIVRHRFKVTVWELRWRLDPSKVLPVASWPAPFAPYLRGDGTVVVDERLRDLAGSIVPERRGELRDLGALMSWVNDNLEYDHSVASLQASSLHAIEKRRGHCSDYHGLCAALGRSLGYPSRVTYGFNAFPKNSPSHCKLEVFLPSYGWVSFDVSETQRLIKKIQDDGELPPGKRHQLMQRAKDRLLSGFRDNTWFLLTRGTDYELAPRASKRVPVVRTIYAEADGNPLPDPDPANPEKREFAWMTVQEYIPDKPVTYPFGDWMSLEERD